MQTESEKEIAAAPTPLIFDGHNDTVINLYYPERGGGRSFFKQSDKGHIDLPRARAGGFGGGMFAVFVTNEDWLNGPPKEDVTLTDNGYDGKPAAPVDFDTACETTEKLTTSLINLIDQSLGQMQLARSTEEIRECFANSVLAVVLHFEGAEMIASDLTNLQQYYDRGLRSLGICWSRPNAFGCGVPFRYPSSPDVGPGLTDAGKELVRECNRLGIMLDLAHLNEKGFWGVAAITNAPLIVSHSAAHALCGSARNLTDKQLDAIGESNGVVGVSFFRNDLRGDGRLEPDTPMIAIVDQIRYIADRIGVEHVAFGSDFDGATVPEDLGDVAGMPKLLAALSRAGYDEESLAKLCRENWLRVLATCWHESDT